MKWLFSTISPIIFFVTFLSKRIQKSKQTLAKVMKIVKFILKTGDHDKYFIFLSICPFKFWIFQILWCILLYLSNKLAFWTNSLVRLKNHNLQHSVNRTYLNIKWIVFLQILDQNKKITYFNCFKKNEY